MSELKKKNTVTAHTEVREKDDFEHDKHSIDRADEVVDCA